MKDLIIHCDSQLVANQLTGEYAARNQMMEAYMGLAQKLFKSFYSSYIERFPRMSNSHANTLVNLASAVESNIKRIIEVEFLPRSNIDAEHDCHIVFDVEADLGGSWMDPIIHYLKDRTLPDDSNESYQIKVQGSRYWLVKK